MKRLKHLIDQYRGLSKTAYVLFFARLVTSMGAFIFPMLTLILTVKLGYTKTYAGFLMTIVSVLMLVANLIGGKIADKYNKKKIIIILDVISVLFFYACAIVQPREMMIYFLVVSGFFATMEGPAFDALLAEATLPAEREKVFSLAYIGFNLGFAFGAAMAGLLFTNYLSLAFILDGTTTIISTFMIIFMVKSYHQEEIKEEDRNEYEDHMDEKESIFKVLRQRKSIIYFILISSIGAFIYQQWNFTLPVYMNHIFGEVDGTKFYGFVASANGLVVILATPIVTHLLRKKFELQKLALGGFLMGLSFLIILWPKYLFLFFLFITIFTIAEAINTIGNSPYMSRRVPGSHRGRLTSIAFLGFFIGGNLGPLVSGYVIDHYGYQTILWIVFVLGMIVSGLFIINDRYDRLIFPKLYMNPPSMIQTSLMKCVEESSDS
jgi:MFS family permease